MTTFMHEAMTFKLPLNQPTKIPAICRLDLRYMQLQSLIILFLFSLSNLFQIPYS